MTRVIKSPTENKSITIRKVATELVLEKTDRILGQDVDVRFSDERIAPGWTDGHTIWISAGFEPAISELKKGFTVDGIVKITGLNYHELAHCMFMPRLNSDLVRKVRDKGAFMAFNMLQDQADETKFVHLYEPASEYFTSLVTTYMMENEEYTRSNYPLISGRLFLPKRLREMFRQSFVNQKIVDDIDALVSEYKRLVYPDDQSEMLRVILDFNQLLMDVNQKHGFPDIPPHDQIEIGNPKGDLSKQIVIEQQEEDDLESAAATAQEDEEGEDQGEDQGTEEVSEAEQGDEGESNQDQTEEEEDKAPPTIDILKELEETYEEAIEEIQVEARERILSIQDKQRDYRVRATESRSHTRVPSQSLIWTSERCAEEFRLQNEKTAPGWHHRSQRGKLNPRRYAKALQGDQNVYRRWHEGINDATDFEVVFLLDYSSSMVTDNKIFAACESLWVLQRAFDSLDGTTTTLGFGGEGPKLFSQRGTRASPRAVVYQSPNGMTYTRGAIDESDRILSSSDRSIKLCVIITDGMFTDEAQASEALSQYPNDIAIIGIKQDVSMHGYHQSVIHTQTIDTATELVDVVKKIAFQLSNQRLQKGNA